MPTRPGHPSVGRHSEACPVLCVSRAAGILTQSTNVVFLDEMLPTRDLRGKTNVFPHPPLKCEKFPSPALTLVQLFPHPHSSRTIISLSRTHPSQPIYFPAISRKLFHNNICKPIYFRLLHSLSNIICLFVEVSRIM